MRKIVIILLVILSLTGCASVLKDTMNLAIIDSQVSSGQVQNTIASIELSETDRLTLTHAINNFRAFEAKWKSSIKILDPNMPQFSTFLSDYTDLVLQYKAIELVIERNWASYTVPNKLALLGYRERAVRANKSVDSLIAAGRRHQAVLDAIIFAQIVAGIIR